MTKKGTRKNIKYYMYQKIVNLLKYYDSPTVTIVQFKQEKVILWIKFNFIIVVSVHCLTRFVARV